MALSGLISRARVLFSGVLMNTMIEVSGIKKLNLQEKCEIFAKDI